MAENKQATTLPLHGDAESIREADVTAFMQTMGAWARALPRRQQALLHLVLAAAASAEHPDISRYLAGFPVPNPRDVVAAAAGTSEGAQAGAVVAPGAEALAGDLTEAAAAGAAGGALARLLLNVWGADPQPV